jgi:hypothetical protein
MTIRIKVGSVKNQSGTSITENAAADQIKVNLGDFLFVTLTQKKRANIVTPIAAAYAKVSNPSSFNNINFLKNGKNARTCPYPKYVTRLAKRNT